MKAKTTNGISMYLKQSQEFYEALQKDLAGKTEKGPAGRRPGFETRSSGHACAQNRKLPIGGRW